MRRLTMTLLGLASASCVPVEAVEIPIDIEWVAVVSDEHEDSRLKPPSTEALFVDRGSAWAVGFTTAQLVEEGLSDALIAGARVQPAAECDNTVVPTWSRRLAGNADLPPLTIDRLNVRGCPKPLTGDSFDVQAYELERTRDFQIVGYGQTDLKEPLIILSNRDVYRITDDGPVFMGRHTAPYLTSVVARGAWVMGVGSGRLWFGRSLETIAPIEAIGDGLSGRLLSTSRFGTRYVGTAGRQPPQNVASDSLVPDDLGLNARVDVIEDDEGALVAVGEDWSWRWTGGRTELSGELGLRAPFAVVDGTYVFGTIEGEIRTPVPEDPTESAPFADVRSVRQTAYFARINALLTYEGGVLAADSLGYVTWVELDGTVTEIAHLISRPAYLFQLGTSVIVVSKNVNAQIFCSGQLTNIIIYVMRRADLGID